MLRSNSRKARENLRNYIIDGFSAKDYTSNIPTQWPEIATFILNTFEDEYGGEWNKKQYPNNQDRFINWCQGLPSVIDTCYYYNRSAVADLGQILEETEEESARYTEQQAEYRLSSLIYMELLHGSKEKH